MKSLLSVGRYPTHLIRGISTSVKVSKSIHLNVTQHKNQRTSLIDDFKSTNENVLKYQSPIDKLEATRELLLQKFQKDVNQTRLNREKSLDKIQDSLNQNKIYEAADGLCKYLELNLSFDYYVNHILIGFISNLYHGILNSKPNGNTNRQELKITKSIETVLCNLPNNEGLFSNQKLFNEMSSIVDYLIMKDNQKCAESIILTLVSIGYIPSNNHLNYILTKNITNKTETKIIKNRASIEKLLDIIFNVYPTIAPLQLSKYLSYIGFWIINSNINHKDFKIKVSNNVDTNETKVKDIIISSRIALYLYLKDDKFKTRVKSLTSELKKMDILLNNDATSLSTDGIGYYYLLCAKLADENKNIIELEKYLNLLEKLNLKGSDYYELYLSYNLRTISSNGIFMCLKNIQHFNIIPTPRTVTMLLHILNETIDIKCFMRAIDILAKFNLNSINISHFTNALTRLKFDNSIGNLEYRRKILLNIVQKVNQLKISYDHLFFEQLIRAHFKLELPIQEAANIFTVMKSFGAKPDVSHYTSFMEGIVSCCEPNVIDKMFNLVKDYMTPEEFLLCKLIAYYNNKKYSLVVDNIKSFPINGPIPVKAFNIALDSLIKDDKPGDVPALFRQMYIMGTGPNSLSYILLYRAFAASGNTKSVGRLYISQTLQNVTFDKDLIYTILFSAAYCHDIPLIEDILKDMRTQYNIPVDSVAIQGIIDGYYARCDPLVSNDILSIGTYACETGLILSSATVDIILESIKNTENSKKVLDKFIDKFIELNYTFNESNLMNILEILDIDIANPPQDTPKIILNLINTMLGDKQLDDQIFMNPNIVAGRINVLVSKKDTRTAINLFNKYVKQCTKSKEEALKNNYMNIEPEIPLDIKPYESMIKLILKEKLITNNSPRSRNSEKNVDAPLANLILDEIMNSKTLLLTGNISCSFIQASPYSGLKTNKEVVDYISNILNRFYSQPSTPCHLDVGPCRTALEVISNYGNEQDLKEIWDVIVNIQTKVFFNLWQMKKLYGAYLVALASSHNVKQGTLLLNCPDFAAEAQDLNEFRRAVDGHAGWKSSARAFDYFRHIQEIENKKQENKLRLLRCLPSDNQ